MLSKIIQKKRNLSSIKFATKYISVPIVLLFIFFWSVAATSQQEFAVVVSGTFTDLDYYRRPYTFYLPQEYIPQALGAIVGIGIGGSDDRVYAWYMDGTVSSGTSWNLEKYRKPYGYSLPHRSSFPEGVVALKGIRPPRYSPQDIVGIAIGKNELVYTWYKDGFVSSGTNRNLGEYEKPYKYVLPQEKNPEDIVGIGIAVSNANEERVYAWYKDGTVSFGTIWNLEKHQKPIKCYAPNYSKKGKYAWKGEAFENIVGMGIAANDHVYTWYRSKGVFAGQLRPKDWCYKIDEPVGMGKTITINFHPMIINVDTYGINCRFEFMYSTGVTWGSEYVEESHIIPRIWSIGPEETKILKGVSVPFHPGNTYVFKGFNFYYNWGPGVSNVGHPCDIWPYDNEFSPSLEPIKGNRFEKGGDMVHKKCPTIPPSPYD